MNKIRILVIVSFFVIVFVPIATFNFNKNAVSSIDNRMLAENPFQGAASTEETLEDQTGDETLSVEDQFSITYTTARKADAKRTLHDYPPYQELKTESKLTGDLTADIESYVNDRIGFRDEMILGYTILNDRLFGKMVHPSYIYGKEGYVFGAALWVNKPYTEYHEAFADMVMNIQEYCETRGVPFLFVFNAAKPAIYTEYLPKGMNYDRSWVDAFFSALDDRGVHYVDTTEVLREKKEEGEVVFNQKYNANHWNDLGAYYGTYTVLEELKKRVPTVHLTSYDELSFSETLHTSLPVSEFPIHETEPVISIDSMKTKSLMDFYNAELYRNPSFATCFYNINEKRKSEGAPRTLVFQGSYMNIFGYKFFSNAFGEYISVHDYQNVIDFEYYYSIFQPDCVVFEVAENVLSNQYFDLQRMQDMDLNPSIDEIDSGDKTTSVENVTVKQGNALTNILWACDTDNIDYAWITISGQVYDMYRTEEGFEVTLKTEDYLATKS